MSHQLAADSARLSASVGSTATYSFPSSATYPTSLLPPATSAASHMTHQVSSAASASSAYQQQSSAHHQLPPTPNSLVTVMGSNSGSSNSAPEHLNTSELPISSVSPAHQQHQAQHQPQQQTSQGNSSPSWNLAISSANRVNLSSPPTSLQQPHTYSHPQPFASHYSAQSFQQPARPTPQPFWYC